MEDNGEYLLQMKGVTKYFPGVLALDDVSFDLKPGEVHVLVGENGAGKSTLIKILSGAYKMDNGELFIEGNKVRINDTHDAIKLGIATCYQEFNLIPSLSAAVNIFLGRFPLRGKNLLPILNKTKMIKDAQEIINSIGIDLDVRSLVRNLTIAQRQMVEIAKALSMNVKIYVLDEPTAVLSYKEIDELFKVIHNLKASGFGIIYISHRLEEVKKIGDRVTILRNGRKIGTSNINEISIDKMVEMMIGRALGESFPERNTKPGKDVLKVVGLCRDNVFRDIDLTVREGEIVGLAGLVGSRRTEVARAIFGADKLTKGKIYISSREVFIKTPKDGVQSGIAYLSEDRKEHGLVLSLSVKYNIVLTSLSSFAKFGFINDSQIRKEANKFVKELSIKTPSLLQKTKNLSGGNQQKVVVAKWLSSGCKIFIFDEPTRGIDVGAKIEVYKLMNELIKQGGAILMISSEMPEIVNMCNRVYVMKSGKICGELSGGEIKQKSILEIALLGKLTNNGSGSNKEGVKK